MLSHHIGELAALSTALLWTVSALIFESLTDHLSSLIINAVRLGLAFFLLGSYGWATRGLFWPSDASAHTWWWLLASGLVGFVFGDYLLFKAFSEIGARLAMLLQALVPPFTALLAFVVLAESLTWHHLIGMAVTLTGIFLVLLHVPTGPSARRPARHATRRGILMGIGAAAGQALGLIFSKLGMGRYDAFGASQIRVLAGTVGFVVLLALLRRLPDLGATLRNPGQMRRLSLGAALGSFLGVSLSLVAVQHAAAGVVATIMALVPVFIIPPSAVIHRERITWRDVGGTLLAVSGTVLFFL
jgi:drug/metabolite transporter (DMT)-like permease